MVRKASYYYSTRRTVYGAIALLGVGVAMTCYFGLVVMRWTVLESFYFFAITISTVGFGTNVSPDERPARRGRVRPAVPDRRVPGGPRRPRTAATPETR